MGPAGLDEGNAGVRPPGPHSCGVVTSERRARASVKGMGLSPIGEGADVAVIVGVGVGVGVCVGVGFAGFFTAGYQISPPDLCRLFDPRARNEYGIPRA